VADIWALGATFYCFVFNELPFWDSDNCENEYSIIEYILHNEVEIPEGIRQIVPDDQFSEVIKTNPCAVSSSLIDLMMAMLNKDPSKRASLNDILECPLLKE
jgi:serine/threonine protein kinase